MSQLTNTPASAGLLQKLKPELLSKPTPAECVLLAVWLKPLFDLCKPPLNDAQVETYYGILCDLPPIAVQAAAAEIASSRVYPTWPMPGEIRAKAISLIAPAESQISDAHAWQRCVEFVRAYGLHAGEIELAKRTGIVAEALREFGWRRFCNVRESDQDTARAQFRDLYNAIMRRAMTDYARLECVKKAAAAIGKSEEAKLTVRAVASIGVER